MITSTSNAHVKQVVQWRDKAKERRKSGIFLVEGLKMYEEAPDMWVQETYITTTLKEELKRSVKEREQTIWNKLQTIGFEEVTQEVFEKMSDTLAPQGILCVIKRPQFTLEDMLERTDRKPPLFVMLEDLQDPGNLGTIVRTGEGAGIQGVIMTRETVDIYNPKTIRATMGSIYRVPHIYIEDLAKVIEKLKTKNIHTYAAHLEGKEYYEAFDFREGTAFMIGNEGNGLKKETADMAEAYLKIPMEGKVESLNAAVATALLMYEAHRQRN